MTGEAEGNERRVSREEIARLRHAIAACERGIQTSESVLVSNGNPETRSFRPVDRLPTGFDALDEATGGGLHRGSLNEIFTAASGSGALEALLPAIAKSGGRERLLAWIHPTRTPYPPALAQAGCRLDQWLIVRPVDDEDHLWSIDQVLRSRACAAAVVFLGDLSDRGLRRLQLSAREGGCVALVFRPAALASHTSPAPVRIFAEPEPVQGSRRRRVRMTVLKSRGTSSFASSILLEWSRDPLDERPSSWFADRAAGADDPGCEQPPARTRSA